MLIFIVFISKFLRERPHSTETSYDWMVLHLSLNIGAAVAGFHMLIMTFVLCAFLTNVYHSYWTIAIAVCLGTLQSISILVTSFIGLMTLTADGARASATIDVSPMNGPESSHQFVTGIQVRDAELEAELDAVRGVAVMTSSSNIDDYIEQEIALLTRDAIVFARGFKEGLQHHHQLTTPENAIMVGRTLYMRSVIEDSQVVIDDSLYQHLDVDGLVRLAGETIRSMRSQIDIQRL